MEFGLVVVLVVAAVLLCPGTWTFAQRRGASGNGHAWLFQAER